MTIHARLKAGTLVLLAGVVAAVAACGGDAAAGGPSEAGVLAEGSSRVINVEISTVRTRDFVERISLTGTVVAGQDVTISAQESGVIRRVVVDKGATVTVGQPLLEVDDAVLRSQVEEATAQASLASETWVRRKRLYEEDVSCGSSIPTSTTTLPTKWHPGSSSSCCAPSRRSTPTSRCCWWARSR